MQNGYGIITPSGLHYERHHGGIPTIDPTKHRLIIHGLVDRPIKYSLADLRRFPTVSRTYFMECSGTTGRELMRVTRADGPALARPCLDVGVDRRAAVGLAQANRAEAWRGLGPGGRRRRRGDDAQRPDRQVSVRRADRIRAERRGDPAGAGLSDAAFLPGWEGNISIKWLRRLEVSDQPYYTREETSKYTDLITRPARRGFHVHHGGEVGDHVSLRRDEAAGAGLLRGHRAGLVRPRQDRARRGIDRRRQDLEPRRAAGSGAADLPDPLPLPVDLDGTATVLQSRATDETGYTQPTHQQLIAERGPLEAPGMMYHMNAIQSWGIAADGSVKNVHPLG